MRVNNARVCNYSGGDLTAISMVANVTSAFGMLTANQKSGGCKHTDDASSKAGLRLTSVQFTQQFIILLKLEAITIFKRQLTGKT